MNFILYVAFTYLGSILAKYFFWLANLSHFETQGKFLIDKAPLRSCFIPLYPFFTTLTFKSNINKYKFQLSEILGSLSFLAVIIGLNYQFTNVQSTSLLILIIYFFIYLSSITLFLYISVYDIIFFQITTKSVILLLLFGILANIAVLLLKFIISKEIIVTSINIFKIGNVQTLLFFIVVYLFSYALIAISKEKYMGFGDADIFGAVALFLGVKYSLIFFLLFPILGSIIGLTYSATQRRIKNLKVPLVPILYLTYLICLFFGDKLIDIILI